MFLAQPLEVLQGECVDGDAETRQRLNWPAVLRSGLRQDEVRMQPKHGFRFRIVVAAHARQPGDAGVVVEARDADEPLARAEPEHDLAQ